MHRFRWRLRTFMVFVVVVAVSLGIHVELRRRGQSYRQAAEYHRSASVQLDWDHRSGLCSRGRPQKQMDAEDPRQAAERTRAREASEYHARLAGKYQRAAERAWLPVVPDPPPPPGSYPKLLSADDY